MNTEEKAKAYDEALERAKDFKNGIAQFALDPGESIVHYIFPELRESEDFDEEVRKWLVGYFSSIKDTVWIHRNTITCEQILSWLEKQKGLMPPVNVDPCDASWYAYYQRGLNRGYELGLDAGMKEQKELPLMDGNADLYFDEWNQQKQNPTKRQCFEEGMRYAKLIDLIK